MAELEEQRPVLTVEEEQRAYEEGQLRKDRRRETVREVTDCRDNFAFAIIESIDLDGEQVVRTSAEEKAGFAEAIWSLADALMLARGNPDDITAEEIEAAKAKP